MYNLVIDIISLTFIMFLCFAILAKFIIEAKRRRRQINEGVEGAEMEPENEVIYAELQIEEEEEHQYEEVGEESSSSAYESA